MVVCNCLASGSFFGIWFLGAHVWKSGHMQLPSFFGAVVVGALKSIAGVQAPHYCIEFYCLHGWQGDSMHKTESPEFQSVACLDADVLNLPC